MRDTTSELKMEITRSKRTSKESPLFPPPPPPTPGVVVGTGTTIQGRNDQSSSNMKKASQWRRWAPVAKPTLLKTSSTVVGSICEADKCERNCCTFLVPDTFCPWQHAQSDVSGLKAQDWIITTQRIPCSRLHAVNLDSWGRTDDQAAEIS